MLAQTGVVVGFLATVLAVGAIASTTRRGVGGRPDAIIALLLGLAAVVIGVLAVLGNLPWFDPATNQVTRLHDWLDVHVSWLTRRP
jgi:hypothetical protein